MWPIWTYQDRMQSKTWPQQTFKPEQAYAKGTSIGLDRSNVPGHFKEQTPPGLFGKPTETDIFINNKPTPSLLDTGSTVSTVSESYFKEHISLPLENLDKRLDKECADGKQLPYMGYIEVKIQIPGHDQQHQCILLVTSDSRYKYLFY